MNKDFLNQIPDGEQPVADKLKSVAESIQAHSTFQNKLESQLRDTHRKKMASVRGWQSKIFPSLGWAILIVGAVFLLNWAVRSLMPQHLPASNETPLPALPTESDTIIEVSPTPIGVAYERYGNLLYLAAPLPDTPENTTLYELRPEQPATPDSAKALAARFGIEGEVYLASSEIPGTRNYMVTDGRQRMYVRSEQYFTYYRDYEVYSAAMFSYLDPLPDAEALNAIDEFLKSHGFDFLYQVEKSPQIVNDFYVIPLSPDNYPLRFDYLLPARLELKLDGEGQVIFAQANLIEIQPVGSYGIISAEEAFQKMLAQNGQVGMQEAMRSGSILKEQYWQRQYPENETVTIYGRVTSFQPVEVGRPLFVSIGAYTVTGNVNGLENLVPQNIAEATGHFQTNNGTRIFVVERWDVSDAFDMSIMGTLRKDGENVILTAFDDNAEYLIENAPADLPFDSQAPDDQLNVNGVLANGQFIWSSIQYFQAGSNFGGGGGGGSGFYTPNLTGTPVPFPTPAPVDVAASPRDEYTVQEGDTLGKIASEHSITIDELLQINGLEETTIFIGQILIVPGPDETQKIDGLRGTLSITIYNKPDGSQRVEYGYLSSVGSYYFLPLEGENLEPLQAYQNRPVDIWGTVELQNSAPILKVERYEIPFPDLQFQIVRGKQQSITIDEQLATLFTTTDGQTYIQFSPDGMVDGSSMGLENDEILMEVLIVPGETFGGYPAMRVFNASMAINPKNGQPQDMQVSSDQVQVIEEPQNPEEFSVSVPTIEKVELVYYTSDPRYKVIEPGKPIYIQPVWRFYGHYDSGDEFEILIQALKPEFLFPEIESIEPPG